ncbi:sugar transferase [Natronolimnohabitans innermongolicus JCM 12255]|uniref:Sugar transferase n=1 Tax=Natronolimnohabitans innermongolicus JCM 12255 TaxID=1227499 RepID=L9XKH0_9EURY|nr:sugar transferase [Natronolimnohabitans innermongolicus JCM 12255]
MGAVAVSALAAGGTAYAFGAVRTDGIGARSVVLVSFVTAMLTAVVCRPTTVVRSRRVTTVLERTWTRVGVVCLALASVAFVGLLEGLGPMLVVGIGLSTGVGLSGLFWLGSRGPGRTLVVGDDPSLLASSIASVPEQPVGIVSPSLVSWTPEEDAAEQVAAVGTDGEQYVERSTSDSEVVTDGGTVTTGQTINGIDRIGGISRLESVIDRYDVDRVVLAFGDGDREEFFGVLDTCHDQGLEVLVHESLSDRVLAGEDYGQSLVRVDLEPIPWYSRVAKRAFDIVFAIVGLVVLAPLIALISIAIRLDSPGPILYSQTRTSELGNEFTVSKFRSMVTDAEAETGATLSDEDAGDVDPRVTRVGRILRKTHMDEIPQLVAVLRGDMSAVGPRPERPELDREIQSEGVDWPKRWFVKPGLTGISQVNGVTGFDPDQKLAYDLEYARRQSLWLDTKLVVMQVLTVIEDAYGMVFGTPADDPESAGRSDGAEQDGDVVEMTEKPPAAEASANDD